MLGSVLPPEQGEAEGCIQCQQGSKLVLFVTGKCHWGCDYCPLSDNRRETPYMFANEKKCESWEEVIQEAEAMQATGTGITGGDPMLDFEKTVEAIQQLKKSFGQQHHIHCYTSIPIDEEKCRTLAKAGLDEIRFHLLDLTTIQYQNSIIHCSNEGIVVGIELPVEPDKAEKLKNLLDDVDTLPVDFVNLNELEITVGNQNEMDIRGFNLAGALTAAAEGSAELASELKSMGEKYTYHIKFCTSSYKDAGQLRHRFRRRAEVNMQPYEVLSEDDTILFGAIPTSLENASDDLLGLQQMLGLPKGWIRYNAKMLRIELPLEIATLIADEVSVCVQMVEVHPTFDRLEVSLVHLNEHR